MGATKTSINSYRDREAINRMINTQLKVIKVCIYAIKIKMRNTSPFMSKAKVLSASLRSIRSISGIS